MWLKCTTICSQNLRRYFGKNQLLALQNRCGRQIRNFGVFVFLHSYECFIPFHSVYRVREATVAYATLICTFYYYYYYYYYYEATVVLFPISTNYSTLLPILLGFCGTVGHTRP